MSRILVLLLAALLTCSLLVYAADWAVWRVRVAHGSGMDEVQVTRMSVATLKAGKEEYYFEGTGAETCTHSLLPQRTAGFWSVTCWWLANHRQRITRY